MGLSYNFYDEIFVIIIIFFFFSVAELSPYRLLHNIIITSMGKRKRGAKEKATSMGLFGSDLAIRKRFPLQEPYTLPMFGKK